MQSSKELVQGVELAGLRQVGKIAGVNDKIGLPVERVDLIHGSLEGSIDIGIGGLVETDVTVADLYKSEVLGVRPWSAQQAGYRHTCGKAPHHTRSSPLHAFQEAAPVDVAIEDARCAFQFVFGLSHRKSFLWRRERRFRLRRLPA